MNDARAITLARKLVAREAETWISTPYHHEARVKHAGVDCAQLLYAVYFACGVIDAFDIEHYPPDWHLHRNAERYLEYVIANANEVADEPDRTPLPGDIVLWKNGRCFAHGGIVFAWPVIIHALPPIVRFGNAETEPKLKWVGEGRDKNIATTKLRPRRIFVPKVWSDE